MEVPKNSRFILETPRDQRCVRQLASDGEMKAGALLGTGGHGMERLNWENQWFFCRDSPSNIGIMWDYIGDNGD